ncbi:hypothetical protein, partial [Nocardia brasiliensis]|uniref:hypothetical protein n=1 Tax=Nocardia brasiliensis TaxID=37326 RepID=UPI002458D52D
SITLQVAGARAVKSPGPAGFAGAATAGPAPTPVAVVTTAATTASFLILIYCIPSISMCVSPGEASSRMRRRTRE